MTRPFRGRPSDRQHKQQVNAALNFLGVPLQNEIPPKRERVKRPVDGKPAAPLEREVLAEVLEALQCDARVAFVDRRQSGVFQDGERYIRVGKRGVLDISGMLRGGRYFEIEVKREGEFPDDNQWKRIYLVRNAGGIAGCAHNAAEALAILP